MSYKVYVTYICCVIYMLVLALWITDRAYIYVGLSTVDY